MTIPRELQRSTPREVELTATGRFVAIVAWLLVGGGITVGALLFANAQKARAFETESACCAPASIVRLSKKGGDEARWTATYTYRVGGRDYERTSRLGRTKREQRFVGQLIDVRYLPEDPGKSWVQGYQPDRIPMFVPPLALIAFGLAGGFIAWAIRDQRAMLTDGRPAIATVVQSKKVSGEHGSHQRVTVNYQTLSGGRTTGRFSMQKAPAVGSELVVLYDAEKPTRVMRYPMPFVRPVSW